MGAYRRIGVAHGEEEPEAHEGDGASVAESTGQECSEEVAEDGRADDDGEGFTGEFGELGGAPGLDFGQSSEVLKVPEHEGPPSGERGCADGDHEQRGGADFAAKQIGDTRGGFLGFALGFGPLFGLGDVASDPEHEQRGEDADEEDVTLVAGHDVGGDGGQEYAEVDAGLENCGDPAAPAFWPGFGEQSRAHGPFTSDAESGDESEDEQLPPGLGDG